MEEAGHLSAFCARYQRAIELIGRRWTGAILRVLLSGEQRFSAIHDAIPELSDRLLAERLRELESEGIVEHCLSADPPHHGLYQLTERGRELGPVVDDVAAWAEKWLPETGAGPAANGEASAAWLS